MIRAPEPQDQPLIETVVEHGQEQIFTWWDELSPESRRNLLGQVRTLDFDQIRTFRRILDASKKPCRKPLHMAPAEVIRMSRSEEEIRAREEARQAGEEALRGGRAGVFLVAGGQGTRLGFEGPKGCFPIGRMTGKSLFAMHAEQILAAVRHYGVRIPWTIMTSEGNDAETREFFVRHGHFGLDPADVSFVRQRMLPALDAEGRILLDAKDHLFMSPNGHGGALLAMADGGVLDDARRRGVDVLSYFQVDNVLIRILDPVFIGYHLMAGAQMSSKMVTKRHAGEKLGHFGRVDGRLCVVEYSDMLPEDMEARTPDGRLKYEAGSIGIHLIDPEFVERKAKDGLELPFHVAHKKIPFVSESGERVEPDEPNGYKFETFIFDALRETASSVILEVRREEEFSPVKNRYGEDSPETARRDLTNQFAGWLEAAGVRVPRDREGNVPGVIEISPLYARNREEFLEKIPEGIRFEPALTLDADGEQTNREAV